MSHITLHVYCSTLISAFYDADVLINSASSYVDQTRRDKMRCPVHVVFLFLLPAMQAQPVGKSGYHLMTMKQEERRMTALH
jgi:hypothetical protein